VTPIDDREFEDAAERISRNQRFACDRLMFDPCVALVDRFKYA